MALVNQYFEYTKQYKNEYGEKTIVLMQVGSFFEVYALRDLEGNLSGSDIESFVRINEMIVATKSNSMVDDKQVVMAGFGVNYLEKYATKLQSHGYTLVVYTQDVQGKNTTRSLSEIISPGTHFSNESSQTSNTTMSLRVEQLRERIIIGIATIDICTGGTTLFQTEVKSFHNPITYDEIEKQVSIHRPAECLIVTNLDEKSRKELVDFVGLEKSKVHQLDCSKESVQNSEKQRYQLEAYTRFFPSLPEEVIHTAILRTHSIASQSLVLLLDFVHRHSPHLTTKLSPPTFEHETNQLILANHSLKQLNILDDGIDTGKLRSVSAFLNNCVTAMGRRRFAYELSHPITDPVRLSTSYETTEAALANDSWSRYRSGLDGHLDMDKWKRKLVMRKTTPKDISMLYQDLRNAMSVLETQEAQSASKLWIDEIERRFVVERCMKIDDIGFDRLMSIPIENLAFLTDDAIVDIYRETADNRRKLESIAELLSGIVATQEKNGGTKKYVRIHDTAKSDPQLILTKRRRVLLEKKISAMEQSMVNGNYTSVNETSTEFGIDLSAISFGGCGANKKEDCVNHPLIATTIRSLQAAGNRMVAELQSRYQTHLFDLHQLLDSYDKITQEIVRLDICQNKCYTAKKYNYCKPNIISGEKKAFCSFTEIRHPLIEHLQTNEIYVTNDLSLGRETDGVLIYGTNAVGKTSFIKSVGIAIIMAQAGLYVPCASFTYSPYDAIFTRILGNDNIFKGLSTFAVEMSELRAILTGTNENSLVLGDELCSGTESDSALSIFTAGLETLHAQRSSFLFATHFHEVTKYDEVKTMERLRLAHMSIHYDESNGELVYDRKLKEGPGEAMYGLEVCKSLGLPSEFLMRAHELRIKYNDMTAAVLDEKGSHFNVRKLTGLCEVCKVERASEVHHLRPQVEANKDSNYIGSFHKNHLANLANVCEKCHHKIHEQGLEYLRQRTSSGWKLTKFS